MTLWKEDDVERYKDATEKIASAAMTPNNGQGHQGTRWSTKIDMSRGETLQMCWAAGGSLTLRPPQTPA